MVYYVLVFVTFVAFLSVVLGDMGDYYETDATIAGHDYLNSYEVFTAYTEVATSQSYLSGTTDDVYATFVGEFSSSGPHLFGSFATGSIAELTTVLSRPIGELQSILFQKNGTDGWLLFNLRCRINTRKYELSGPAQWLDNFDQATYDETGNGYEPDSVLDLDDLPASGKMEYTVTTAYFDFSST